MVGRCEYLLDAVVESARDEWLMEPMMQLSQPVKFAVCRGVVHVEVLDGFVDLPILQVAEPIRRSTPVLRPVGERNESREQAIVKKRPAVNRS